MRIQAETLLKLAVVQDGHTSLKHQLYCGIRSVLLSGSVPPETRLPSTRRFAHALGISRTTVVDVFEQLLADGLITGRAGAGTFVAEGAHTVAPPLSTLGAPNIAVSDRARAVALAAGSLGVAPESNSSAFGLGFGGADIFPMQAWLRLSAQAARGVVRSHADIDEAGYVPLRRALMHRLQATRGIRCCVEQVFVFTGVRHALDVTAQLLTQCGDLVVLDDPGNPHVQAAFAATGANIVRRHIVNHKIAGPSDEHFQSVRVVCVSPEHHFPSGATMSLHQRTDVLAEAARRNAWVVEEDIDAELRYDSELVYPLQRLDVDGRVVHIASFSQAFFPVVDLTAVVVPAGLIDTFRAANRVGGIANVSVDFAAATRFLEDSNFTKHVTRLQELYLERREALLEAASQRLDCKLRLRSAPSGIYLFGQLPQAIRDTNVTRVARAHGIAVRAVSPFSDRESPWNGLLLGFAQSTPSQIHAGVAVLERCLSKSR